MSSRTCCCKKLSLIFALLALAVLAAPAFGQNCLQDQYTASGGGKLQCTANDVSIAAVKNVQVIGGVGNKCLAGQPFSFTADFEILTTSKSSRSNIGLYFGTGTGTGQIGALSGTCTDSIIAPQHPCAPGSLITCGSAQYAELDGSPTTDNCGDTSSTDSSPAFGAGTEDVVIQVNNVTCPLTGTSLSLPECTSWQVPGKQLTCFSPSPSFPYETTAIPGSPSKCSCGTLTIPVQPIQPTATVAKSCNTAASQGAGLIACNAGQEGSTVTYHVAVTNTTPAGEGGLIVDQICDSVYGNIFTASGFTPACPAGSPGLDGTASNVNCPPADIANGGTGTCDFTAVQGELATVTDMVTVKGHSDLVSTVHFGPDTSNSVTVTSTDAPSSATITKGWVANTHACVTVRYSVDVHNSSGFDENLTLTGLKDDGFGDITKWTGTGNTSVLGTTCGVAVGSPGLGSLGGVTASATNGGALPATLTAGGADYQCQFDAQFCGDTGPISFSGGTCNGIEHKNTVSANTIHGDEGANDLVTETDHQLTVDECIDAHLVSN
jgi:hypothetical protein